MKPRDTELKLGVCEHCPGDWAKALDLTVQGTGLGGTDGVLQVRENSPGGMQTER